MKKADVLLLQVHYFQSEGIDDLTVGVEGEVCFVVRDGVVQWARGRGHHWDEDDVIDVADA